MRNWIERKKIFSEQQKQKRIKTYVKYREIQKNTEEHLH